jgi:hypothetical protein
MSVMQAELTLASAYPTVEGLRRKIQETVASQTEPQGFPFPAGGKLQM